MQSYSSQLLKKDAGIESILDEMESSDSEYDDNASNDSATDVAHIMKKQMNTKIRMTLKNIKA